MESQFKSILSVIDKIAAMKPSNELFENGQSLSEAEKSSLEKWSGKTIAQIKNITSTSYGKGQIKFNPFTEDNGPKWLPVIFSAFEENSKSTIFYAVENTDFGKIIIASTDEGVCYLVFFSGDENKVEKILRKEFPSSTIIKGKNEPLEIALNYLSGDATNPVPLHVKGTPDNLKIWEALCTVPVGSLISYGTLAKATGHMAQDIGVAMGDNRIAMLIPCHRVIKSTGELGQYHWGAKRKQAMIIKEAVV